MLTLDKMDHSMTKTYESIFEVRDKGVLDHHLAVPSGEARAQFSKVLDVARIDKKDVVITDHGRPIAAVVPISDLKILDWLKRNNSPADIFRLMESNDSLDEQSRVETGVAFVGSTSKNEFGADKTKN
jgi:prevent-host-death family protein